MDFPGISPNDLCFFNGRISCWIQRGEYYLVDGVGIYGVSGGPVFAIDDGKIVIVGLVSSYIPNQVAGILTPGLCVVRDIPHVREMASQMKKIEESVELQNTELPKPSQSSPSSN